MADTTTTTYGLTKIEVGASEDTWGTKLNANFDSLDDLLDGTTVVTGISLDDTATLVDNLDNTKVAQFQLSSIATGTTRTFTLPDASGTVALTDDTLTSIAALGTAADRAPYFTGVNVAAEFTLTAAGRALLDDADAAAQRTTLGLGTAATRAAEDTLTDGANLPDGAAVKAYVDAAVAAIDVGVGNDAQSWQAVTRTASTVYQNTTGAPIQVIAHLQNFATFQVSADNVTWITIASPGSLTSVDASPIIPVNHYYQYTGSLYSIYELR